MADNVNHETNSSEKAIQTKKTEEQSPFTFIDSGEQLAEEIQTVKNELHKQALSLAHKVDLVWEVVRTVIVFVIPVVSCLGLSFLSQFYLPGWMSVVLTTLFIGITVGLVFLNLTPLNEAVTEFIEFRIYTPKFPDCLCKNCSNSNNCNDDVVPETPVKDFIQEIPVKELRKLEQGETNTEQYIANEESEASSASSEDFPNAFMFANEQSKRNEESEATSESSEEFPNAFMFANEGIRRRSVDLSPSSEQSVFRETNSFLESSINSQPNEENVENELEID